MKITIIGAGIAGLTVAISLRKFRPDLELEIYEGSPELRAAGAGLALGANAILGFDHIGVKTEVLAASNVLECFKILDPKGRVITQSDNLVINRNLQTISNFAVHRADLQQVLLAQLPGVAINLCKRVWDFRQVENEVQICFADGSSTRSDYVVATDGIHSIFRKKLLPESKIRFAGYTCWRGVVGGGEDLPSFKNLRGLNPATASETWGLGKRFGIVPLPNDRIYWFACLNSPKAKEERFAAFGKQELLENFGELHAPIPEIIQLTDPSKILWNDILDFSPVKNFAFDRVLLLGDAAHATTPNMGQGACQAIEGAVILGKTLAKIADPQAAFQAFEQVRLKRTALIVNRSWQLGKLAQLANPVLAALRNGVFRLVPDQMNERQVKELLDVEF
ncbi:MAG: FAD-dependent monooxygenase [Saprospiraceae bacterium]|nr:FAD-dependent monooxygenase [Saprospiraceae bacterium]MCF8249598.1 FAD-dependent monooxygenase [Saprospiraceae bacterium]MCF8280498.1 FAD-dependent monooxygenase [Bacteroidales bacterium]MCF8310430.1 FAD-dependent monooxygenase [Saprospiraceae bacterium]MCF8439808.1 FAD-dependent monooxygenase [Saprospiraceae bacterium]